MSAVFQPFKAALLEKISDTGNLSKISFDVQKSFCDTFFIRARIPDRQTQSTNEIKVSGLKKEEKEIKILH